MGGGGCDQPTGDFVFNKPHRLSRVYAKVFDEL
jgi:hypothetical protein